MSRGPCNFRQRDVEAAVKAVTAAGVKVVRVEVENGKISIVTDAAEPKTETEPEVIL